MGKNDFILLPINFLTKTINTKQNTMKKLVLSTALLFVLSLSLTSCRDAKKSNTAEDAIENATEAAGDAVNDAVEATTDAVEKAATDAVKATEEAVGEVVDSATEAAADAVNDAADAVTEKIKDVKIEN